MPAVIRRELLIVAAIIALAGFFRFYAITEIPPGLWPDEAANGIDALQALESGQLKIFYPENNGREGLFINIQALAVKIFGNEPWALRVVSAVFGTLTVLGIYLVTRELFTQSLLQVKNSKIKIQNDNPKLKVVPTKWASKILHFAFCTLNLSNREREMPANVNIALLSAFFLATSFWHINFSRIGFRAITVPFFATFGMYWLMKALRTGKISSAVLGGIFTGLGFHTYIAFRFMPFVLAVPIIISLREWWQENQKSKIKNQKENVKSKNKPCAPCIVALFLFVTFIVALPIGLYFLEHPEDFASRASPISIFADTSPLKAFIKSNLLTLAMFNFLGDCNPRHNFFCFPQLYWPVGLLFLIGFVTASLDLFRKPPSSRPYTLFAWFFFMTLPSTLTREGLPHALRAIGLIPPAFIFAGIGAVIFRDWFKKKMTTPLEELSSRPQNEHLRPKFRRIKREFWILALVIFLWMATHEGIRYLLRWAPQPSVAQAFESSKTELAYYIRTVPSDIPVYVMVNEPSLLVNGVSLNAQPVVFLTYGQPNIFFVDAKKIDNLPPYLERAVIVGLHTERDLLKELGRRYPNGMVRPFTSEILPFVIPK